MDRNNIHDATKYNNSNFAQGNEKTEVVDRNTLYDIANSNTWAKKKQLFNDRNKIFACDFTN